MISPQEPTNGLELAGKRILVTGGTGLIGSALLPALLSHGSKVTLLTRNPAKAELHFQGRVRSVDNLSALNVDDAYDYLINLAGESLAQGRWTSAKKRRLFDSRLGTTAALLAWARRAHHKPAYLISASAVGFYGPRDDKPLDETDTGVASFGHDLCSQWEAATEPFAQEGVAVTRLRLGVVFARSGGAFEQIRQSFDFKVASIMGEGDHYCSWVHLQDVVRIMEFLLTQPSEQRLTGAVNATAPEPLPYAELARRLGRAKHTLLTLKLPSALLRLALGEMADELLLQGQRVVPARLQQAGFRFQYPTFAEALGDLLT